MKYTRVMNISNIEVFDFIVKGLQNDIKQLKNQTFYEGLTVTNTFYQNKKKLEMNITIEKFEKNKELLISYCYLDCKTTVHIILVPIDENSCTILYEENLSGGSIFRNINYKLFSFFDKITRHKKLSKRFILLEQYVLNDKETKID